MQLTYSGWVARPGLHTTNYLRRNLPTNFLTFYFSHCFLSPVFPQFSFTLATMHYFQKYQSAKGLAKYTDIQIGLSFFDRIKNLSLSLSYGLSPSLSPPPLNPFYLKKYICLIMLILYNLQAIAFHILLSSMKYILYNRTHEKLRVILNRQVDECLMFSSKLHKTVLMVLVSAFVTKFETTLREYIRNNVWTYVAKVYTRLSLTTARKFILADRTNYISV